MNKATIKLRLAKLKTLMNSVDVPEDFTMSYDKYTHKFDILKRHLENYMESAVTALLKAPAPAPRSRMFRYYNEWYRVLSKIYLKENETIQSSSVTRRVKS